MTFSSVLHASLALLWCAGILLSLAGWGFLAARWLRIREPGTGLATALGLAFECALSGLLNLLHLITAPVLVAVTVGGIILFVVTIAAARTRSPDGLLSTPRSRLLMAGAIVLIVLHLFSFVRMFRYNACEAARVAVCPCLDCQGGNCNLTAFTANADDLQAYMFLPVKMLERNSFEADPFSQRRIMGSLGFNYFLQDIFLSAGDLRNISVVDGGLGVLLLAAVAIGLAQALGLTQAQTLVFFLLAAYTKQIFWNLSFVWLPCALFLAMALIACRDDLLRRPRLQALCLGAVGGAATALKNNYLVYVVLFILTFYCLLAVAQKSGRLVSFVCSLALAMAGALGVMILWMFAQHQTSGTWFFPILGHGFEYTTYHLLPTRSITTVRQLLKCCAFAVPSFLVAGVVAVWAKRSPIQLVALAASLAGGLATLATGVATGADMLRRYCYPQIMVAFLLLFPLLCFALNARQKPLRFGRLLQAAACALVLLAYVTDIWNSNTGFDRPKVIVSSHTDDFVAGLRDEPLNSPQIVTEYHAVEAALPAHSVALEAVTYPYLFDNTRNTYFEASFPAMASPPPAPGWPIFADGEALAAWLLRHNVRYLIYAYVDQALAPGAMEAEFNDPKRFPVVRATALALEKAHAQYDELAKTRRHLYDDGSIYVLDLQQRQ